ncbi:prepilin-type N-terminal cleavage/methylation domain-containing protein [Halofilum ochraceum]|uniref:prepilin-type N-terminal cleavage/methylation domain-containing protein n=1 Tax=Halofilum ochraceum TaxID=1611323 RepID=UPI0008D95F75|nr:prepilin-type N-terminal cleavage/methylation domain-containing protein [Halofilum ochraceum]
MMNKQQGFTLIELVAVIVILGALAVVALPRFINLQDEANEAALEGVAGAAGSAMAVNLAGVLASDQNAENVDNCNDVGALLQGGLASNYEAENETINPPNGTEATCTLRQDANNEVFSSATNSTTFTGYYASN